MWEALLYFVIAGLVMLGIMAFMINFVYDVMSALRRRVSRVAGHRE